MPADSLGWRLLVVLLVVALSVALLGGLGAVLGGADPALVKMRLVLGLVTGFVVAGAVLNNSGEVKREGPVSAHADRTFGPQVTCRRGARLDDDDIVTDDGLPRPGLAELDPAERVAVEAASYGGWCGCEYCRNVLPFVHPEPWREGRLEDIATTWTALDGLASAENAARKAVAAFGQAEWRDHPLGPPQLVSLRDALAAQGLTPPLACLAPMLVQRAR